MFFSLPLLTVVLGVAAYKVCSDTRPTNIIIRSNEDDKMSMKVTGPQSYSVEGLTPAQVADSVLQILNSRDYTSILYDCPCELKAQVVFEIQKQSEASQDDISNVDKMDHNVIATSDVLKMWRARTPAVDSK
jgi:hypothetical protein